MTEPTAQHAAAENPGWLTPGVAGIGTASFLADVGHEIPTALLPSLLTSTLGAPAAALGLIEGISDGLAGATRFIGGPLADDPHRRRVVAVGGYTVTAVLSAGIAAASSVWQVGLLRAGAWAARGLRVPARNALLADVVPPGRYGAAYGFERAADNAGALAGPLLALALVAAVGTRWAIALSVVPGMLAAAAIVYAVRRAPHLADRPRRRLHIQVRPVLHADDGRLGRLMAGITLFEVGNVAATLLILRATDQLRPALGADDATKVALLLYAGYNLAATVASVPAGRLADRLGGQGPRRILLAGVAAFALSYAAFAADADSAWALLVPFVVAGVGIAGRTAVDGALTRCRVHLSGDVYVLAALGLLAAGRR